MLNFLRDRFLSSHDSFPPFLAPVSFCTPSPMSSVKMCPPGAKSIKIDPKAFRVPDKFDLSSYMLLGARWILKIFCVMCSI